MGLIPIIVGPPPLCHQGTFFLGEELFCCVIPIIPSLKLLYVNFSTLIRFLRDRS